MVRGAGSIFSTYTCEISLLFAEGQGAFDKCVNGDTIQQQE
jgi:hypothetical protein